MSKAYLPKEKICSNMHYGIKADCAQGINSVRDFTLSMYNLIKWLFYKKKLIE